MALLVLKVADPWSIQMTVGEQFCLVCEADASPKLTI